MQTSTGRCPRTMIAVSLVARHSPGRNGLEPSQAEEGTGPGFATSWRIDLTSRVLYKGGRRAAVPGCNYWVKPSTCIIPLILHPLQKLFQGADCNKAFSSVEFNFRKDSHSKIEKNAFYYYTKLIVLLCSPKENKV